MHFFFVLMPPIIPLGANGPVPMNCQSVNGIDTQLRDSIILGTNLMAFEDDIE